MMSKLLALTKVLLKTNFLTGFGDSSKKKKNKRLGIIGIILLLAFVMGSLGVPIIFALDSILEVLPIQNIVLSLGIKIIAMLVVSLNLLGDRSNLGMIIGLLADVGVSIIAVLNSIRIIYNKKI